MKHGSLFSGIGGFDLAAEWIGWENIFHCEIEPFCQRVLKYYWPKAILYEDITKTDFTIHRGLDILTGGFPCQPYSAAGKRLGTEDDRHLWPEMLRAIREIQPTWVVGENVFGLVNWSGGLVFEEVQTDLEAEGYEVQPYILPAAGVGAPHRRDRVWFVAYNENTIFRSKTQQGWGINRPVRNEIRSGHTTNGKDGTPPDTRFNGCQQSHEPEKIDNKGIREGVEKGHEPDTLYGDGDVADTERSSSKRKCEQRQGEGEFGRCDSENASDTSDQGLQGGKNIREFRESREKQNKQSTRFILPTWENFPTQSPVCGGDDGIPRSLDSITFSKWRNESIKGYGNAIAPQVVYQIFKAINQYTNTEL